MNSSEAEAELRGAAEVLEAWSVSFAHMGGVGMRVMVCSREIALGWCEPWRATRRQEIADGKPCLLGEGLFGRSARAYVYFHPRVTTGVVGWIGGMPTDDSWDDVLESAWALTVDASVAARAGGDAGDGTYEIAWCEQPPAGVRWIDARHAVVEREDRRTGEVVVERAYVFVRENVWAVCDEEQAAVVLDVIATAGEPMGGKRKPGVVRKRLVWRKAVV